MKERLIQALLAQLATKLRENLHHVDDSQNVKSMSAHIDFDLTVATSREGERSVYASTMDTAEATVEKTSWPCHDPSCGSIDMGPCADCQKTSASDALSIALWP